MAKIYLEDNFKIHTMENICYKSEDRIENEGKERFTDINSDIHKQIQKE
ncbi:hypothetical protein [Fusibacter ferrireducens]|uniref:Uncharacterized protein n=1 Tax=Fusibacter ferrireducens TaxID=2785058 RepID=A0ABR9ZZJ8_9FIRM|nr:hypothetical protein [Fusibacter ferrireducens]MBF4695875.1 hypothetical protein [Fusibacter ferrireducens]